MTSRCNMISFELTAIDLILVIAVIVLLILYLTKFSVKTFERKSFRQPSVKDVKQERSALMLQSDYTECPRGFGNIKKLSEDNSVSDRCLRCYKLIACYTES